MARFLDHMMTRPITRPSWMPEGDYDDLTPAYFIRALISSSEVISCDNVAEYYFAGTDQENWYIEKDFPCLAPPFHDFWMEYHRPTKTVSSETGTLPGDSVSLYTGFYFMTLQPDHEEDYEKTVEVFSKLGEDASEFLKKQRKNIKWFLFGVGYEELDEKVISYHRKILSKSHGPEKLAKYNMEPRIVGPLGMWMFALDEYGRVIDKNFRMGFNSLRYTEDMAQAVSTSISTSIHPCLLALSFMNTKGTVIHKEDPPVKLNKARVKQGKTPFVSFKTIEVVPMDRIVRKSRGERHAQHKDERLHIVRGHLADYRQGKGLFGKHRGIFWISSHFKGEMSKGINVNSYEVKKEKSA